MVYKYYDAVFEYATSILEGRKVACKETIQACQRFMDDLNDPRYELKAEKAELAIHIIHNTFRHIKGPAAGEFFIMSDWQLFIIYNVLGIYLKDTDERKYKETFIFIPRKNAKTLFASALAWAIGILENKYFSSVYIVATKLDRALEAFNNILENVERMGEAENFRIRNSTKEYSLSRNFFNSDGEKVGSFYCRAMPQDAKRADGMNAPFFILDELHGFSNANEYHVYKQAQKAYPTNRLLIGITTAGISMNSFAYERLLYCQKVLNKDVQDEQYFIFIAKADEDERGNVNYDSAIEHEKANPNYNVSVRGVDLMADALQAMHDPSSRNEFLNKSLNIYTNTASSYFDMNEVQLSDDEHNFTMEELLKLPITWYGGADLSIMHDLTAACLLGRYNDIDIVIAHGFIPITQARTKAIEDNVPFNYWNEQGWLTLCNGDIVDYDDVVKWFIEMRNKGFKIKNVSFDRYNSRDFVRSMEKHKFKMIDSNQRYWVKSEAFREIERQIKERKFTYLSNKAYAYCISNVKAKEDAEERVRFEKVSPKFRIDLFDASVIAMKQAIIERDKKSVSKEWF